MKDHFHYKIYKPVGYLSQFINNQTRRKNKKLLGELHDFHPDTMAIGRLDENSEGLLLLTTNGKLCNAILSDKYEKEYYVQLDGEITGRAVQQLESGIDISVNGKLYTTKPCLVHILENPVLPETQRPLKPSGTNKTSWISIILKEGKFRQIRKMTSKVGFPTLRLVRVRVGNETIKNLDVGEVVQLMTFQL